MNKSFKFIVILLTVFLIFGLSHAQKLFEAIVVIVNDDVITLSDYKANYDELYQTIRTQSQGGDFIAQFDLAKKYILDTMITNVLLLQEARKQGLNVEEQLKMSLDKIKKENDLTSDAELIRAVEQQGTTFEVFRKRMEENLMRQGVIFTEIRRSIVIDDSDFVDYYKKHPEEFIEPAEYKIRAIYISGEDRSVDEVESKKKDIDGKLAAGTDMAEIAGQLSEGPEKETQGDLGTFKSNELAVELRDAVKDLKVGELADWLEMRGGWFRLKLEEKKDSRLKTFEESRQQIERKLYQALEQEKMKEYLAKLKARSYVKILIANPEDYI